MLTETHRAELEVAELDVSGIRNESIGGAAQRRESGYAGKKTLKKRGRPQRRCIEGGRAEGWCARGG